MKIDYMKAKNSDVNILVPKAFRQSAATQFMTKVPEIYKIRRTRDKENIPKRRY